MAELVFSEAMWGMYQPLMRSDFKLFDEYEHLRGDAATSSGTWCMYAYVGVDGWGCGLRVCAKAISAYVCPVHVV